MRLKAEEIKTIKEIIKFRDSNSRIILFGSRVDDSKKGGDIDLLIYSKKLVFEDKLKILSKLYEKLGEQKIDIVIAKNNKNPFVKLAESTGVEL